LNITGVAMYGWGRSDYGQIGHSGDVKSGDQEESPKRISFPMSMNGKRIKDIVAGTLISMAISEDNEVYTWGFAESGATGHILENDVVRPKQLDVLKKKYGKRGGPTNCHVLSASGGGCHSLMVIERFA
jgi:alpha-tubulin suppressor-like RCC1 family protein